MLVALFVRLLQRGEAIIGTDGILLTRALWGRQFIPYGDIDTLVSRYRRLELTTHDGKRHLLAANWNDPFTPEISQSDEQWANKALHYRIVQAAARRQLGGEGISLKQLERQGRDVAQWHEALRRIGAAVGGYRNPAVMTQSLAAVVEDPGEHPERRVGDRQVEHRDEVVALADEALVGRHAHVDVEVAVGSAVLADAAASILEERRNR